MPLLESTRQIYCEQEKYFVEQLLSTQLLNVWKLLSNININLPPYTFHNNQKNMRKLVNELSEVFAKRYLFKVFLATAVKSN